MPYLRMMKIYRLRDVATQCPGHSVLMLCFLMLAITSTKLNAAEPQANNTAKTTIDNTNSSVENTSDNEADSVEVSKTLEDLLRGMNLGNFEYQTEERPDPFMPFISEKNINPTENDSETGERLTGMRQFEPGQLNLVAIIFTESNPMAMVEDSSHKGYLVHRGTKIGKTGIVTDILPNEVIIKQLSYSMDQATKYSTMEMILRKEGEK